jgi:gamma-glutamylcyclotransferase (GGCT)/AIG2-like uncharacterized protein YtfP
VSGLPAAGPAAVFVYGTLMPGGRYWPALAPFAAGWEATTVAGVLYDTGRGYPAARFPGLGDSGPELSGRGLGGALGGDARSDPSGPPVVHGVRVRLDPAVIGAALDVMDRSEDEGVLYRRLVVVTAAGPAWSYAWCGPQTGLTRLEGRWG